MRYGFCMLGAVVFALTLNAQTDRETKLVGKWKLNIAKSQYHGHIAPTDATVVVSQATAAHFKYHATFRYPDRRRSIDSGFDGAIDGQPHEYKGPQRGARLSFVDVDGALEGTAAYPDGTIEHETITVSADGNTMTSQSKLSLPTGTESWTEIWERVPDKKRK